MSNINELQAQEMAAAATAEAAKINEEVENINRQLQSKNIFYQDEDDNKGEESGEALLHEHGEDGEQGDEGEDKFKEIAIDEFEKIIKKKLKTSTENKSENSTEDNEENDDEENNEENSTNYIIDEFIKKYKNNLKNKIISPSIINKPFSVNSTSFSNKVNKPLYIYIANKINQIFENLLNSDKNDGFNIVFFSVISDKIIKYIIDTYKNFSQIKQLIINTEKDNILYEELKTRYYTEILGKNIEKDNLIQNANLKSIINTIFNNKNYNTMYKSTLIKIDKIIDGMDGIDKKNLYHFNNEIKKILHNFELDISENIIYFKCNHNMDYK